VFTNPSTNATTTGEQALIDANLSSARYWKSEIILISMVIGYRIIAYFGVRRNKG